jgi:CRP/FNR family cyclic AMP-dependent transcriptional regulator
MNEARLSGIPLFASLSKKERKRLARCADEVDVPEGRHLVDEGDFSYEFFVIEEGRADVLHGGRKLAELGPGDFFGEMGLVDHIQRKASVVATSRMTAIVMTGRDFRLATREMPEMGQRIATAIEERVRALTA